MNYLGDDMPTFALNFSRPGSQIVTQYYNFLRLGFDGYAKVQGYSRDVATYLSEQDRPARAVRAAHQGRRAAGLRLHPGRRRARTSRVFDVADALRERGWLVPAYTFPKNREDLAALRIVVRRGFTHDVADLLLADFERQLPRLRKQAAPVNDGAAASFHH